MVSLQVLNYSVLFKFLVVIKGYLFEYDLFFVFFDVMENVVWIYVEQFVVYVFLDIKRMEFYDVIVFYDMGGIEFYFGVVLFYYDYQFKEEFVEFFKIGKGCVFLYYVIVVWLFWLDYVEIVGGCFFYQLGMVWGEDCVDFGY